MKLGRMKLHPMRVLRRRSFERRRRAGGGAVPASVAVMVAMADLQRGLSGVGAGAVPGPPAGSGPGTGYQSFDGLRNRGP
ncbi:hypothetical protein GCM10025774_25700 [Microbacterium kyungheense]